MDVSMQYIPNAWTFLVFANVLLLIVGTFLDPIASIMILVPILMPIAISFQIDPIHFCMVITIALGIGYITPPLGLLLYAATAITREDFTFEAKAILPTLAVYVILLFMISFIPSLSTAVPDLLLGKG